MAWRRLLPGVQESCFHGSYLAGVTVWQVLHVLPEGVAMIAVTIVILIVVSNRQSWIRVDWFDDARPGLWKDQSQGPGCLDMHCSKHTAVIKGWSMASLGASDVS